MIPRSEGPVRVLELGANPYFMTLLVQKYLGYEVTPANFFGDYRDKAAGQDETTIRSRRHGETHARAASGSGGSAVKSHVGHPRRYLSDEREVFRNPQLHDSFGDSIDQVVEWSGASCRQVQERAQGRDNA